MLPYLGMQVLLTIDVTATERIQVQTAMYVGTITATPVRAGLYGIKKWGGAMTGPRIVSTGEATFEGMYAN